MDIHMGNVNVVDLRRICILTYPPILNGSYTYILFCTVTVVLFDFDLRGVRCDTKRDSSTQTNLRYNIFLGKDFQVFGALEEVSSLSFIRYL